MTNIYHIHRLMKKIITTTFLFAICLSLFSQMNPVRWHFEAGGPPAGETWEESQFIPGHNEPVLRELDYDSLKMEFTGNWPYGQSFSVSSSSTGDTVFFGSGGGVLIVDASDPYNPILLSEVRARALIDHTYYDAASGLLFLAAYFSGVEIWDVSDILNPVRLSRIPLNSYPRGGIYARDGILYIVTVADGMYMADVSNPSNPSIISHQTVSGSLVWTSSFDGDYAYLSQGSSGLKIIDISDPYNPFQETTFSTNATGLQVVDGTGYIVTSNFGLYIYDFSDLGSIIQISELPLDGNPNRLAKSGDYLYIANSTSNPGGGINTIDISDPVNPSLVTTIDPPETFISGSGQVIAASGNSSGFLLLDISDPANPLYASEMNTAWSMVDIYGSGDYAYTGSNGFRVFDMSDPSYPEQIGFDETQGALVETAGDIAIYIPQSMTANNHVNAMDISDPANPELLDYYNSPAMTYGLALTDHYAFIACWWDGFRVVDFEDPNDLSLASHDFGWTSGAEPGVEWCYVQALDIYGDYLYVLDYGPFETEDTKGLYIWDISTPDNPQLLHRFADYLSKGHDLKVWGNYAYISDKEGGLEVVDVTDPMSPATVGYVTLPDVAWGLDFSFPYAYVAEYILGGVQIVDVSNPFDPQIAAYYQRSGCFALGATAWNNYALVADGPAGFQVYDFMLATDIEEPARITEKEIEIYPNPATDKVQIRMDLNDAEQLNIIVTDPTGKCVIRSSQVHNGKGVSTIVLVVNSLTPGLYFIQITGKNTNAFGKLLIN